MEPEWTGFEGGYEYMREQSSQTSSFGNIREAFEKTRCFLLKHPGLKVSSSGAASQIKIAGMHTTTSRKTMLHKRLLVMIVY